MRFNFGLNWHYASIAALALLSACGGGDGGQASASRAGAAVSSPSTPALIAPAPAVAATPGVDKTVSPVEMPDTVIPVNYRLWFRPNPELNAFDGRADVEI
jgi:aminopeptidase N